MRYRLLGSRVDLSLVDISGATGYALVGAKRADPHAEASQYYQVFFLSILTYLKIFVIHFLNSLIGNMLKRQRNPP